MADIEKAANALGGEYWAHGIGEAYSFSVHSRMSRLPDGHKLTWEELQANAEQFAHRFGGNVEVRRPSGEIANILVHMGRRHAGEQPSESMDEDTGWVTENE